MQSTCKYHDEDAATFDDKLSVDMIDSVDLSNDGEFDQQIDKRKLSSQMSCSSTNTSTKYEEFITRLSQRLGTAKYPEKTERPQSANPKLTDSMRYRTLIKVNPVDKMDLTFKTTPKLFENPERMPQSIMKWNKMRKMTVAELKKSH